MSALRQNLPRRSLAVAAATPLITDTKADGRRGRNGPIPEIWLQDHGHDIVDLDTNAS